MAVEVVGEVDVGGEIAVKVGQVCLHRVLFEETSRHSSTCLEDLQHPKELESQQSSELGTVTSSSPGWNFVLIFDMQSSL